MPRTEIIPQKEQLSKNFSKEKLQSVSGTEYVLQSDQEFSPYSKKLHKEINLEDVQHDLNIPQNHVSK